MKKEFKLPNLGENISSAEVIKLLVAVGDKLEKEQAVAEISSDKATIEVPSDISGVIKEINIKEGDSITVGQTILSVEVEDESSEAEKTDSEKEQDKTKEAQIEEKPAAKKTEAVPPAQPNKSTKQGNSKFILPNLGENITSAEVLKVLVKAGDKLEKEQSVLEISSDKATLEVPADISGVIKEVSVKEGDSVKEGQLILTLEAYETDEPEQEEVPAKTEGKTAAIAPPKEEIKPEPAAEKPPKADTESVPKKPKEIAPAAPSIRRFAREIGIEINQVNGSGPGGRISIEDVKAFSRNLNKGGDAMQGTINKSGTYSEPLPDFSRWGEVSREPMNNIR